MHKRLLALCFILVLLFITSTAAQSPNGTVSGIVLDPSGGSVAGADIVIINDATGVKYSGKTNGDGIYVVPNLQPGSYRIQVSNSGFKTIIKPDIVLHIGDALAINFTLPIGAASEIVTVEGGAPLINTQDAAVSTVIDRKFVESLPLNGRSFNTLLQLTPGVVIAPSNSFSPGQFSIAGQRSNANNFTVDGVSADFGVVATTPNVRQSGTGAMQAFSAVGGTSSLVSVEALQEFRIETSSFAPEFGRSPGGQVILTTRSGVNDFHGGGYNYFRNDILDANDWFANQSGKPRAAERHNDFGAYLGGPIVKDNTFFFLSYEGAQLRLPQARSIWVPSEYARTQAPANLAPFLNAYPEPDDRTIATGVYTSPFTGVWSNSATLNAGSVRLDHTFNSRLSIFGRYSDAPSEVTSRQQTLSTLSATTVNTRTLTLGINAHLSKQAFNAFRANYSTQRSANGYSVDSFGGAVSPPSNLLSGTLSSQANLAYFILYDVGLYYIGPAATNATRQFNFGDDFSLAVSAHQTKYGVDYRAIDLQSDSFQHSIGFSAPSVQAFLSSNGQVALSVSTTSSAQIRSQALSLYAQDSWKVSPRVTLTYGIRWELSPPPSPLGSTTLASWANIANPSQIVLAPPGTPTWRTRYANFAPRAGLAYDLTNRGDFVLRAGGGVFYDLGVGSSVVGYFPNLAISPIVNVQVPVVDLTPYLPLISLRPPYPAGITYGFSPDLKLPRSYQWNIALEKAFSGKQVISATYVGQSGQDLLRQEALYQPNSNFLGALVLTANNARSNYNALQLQYRRPLSARLQALMNYTWSHSLDNASNDVLAGLSSTVISAANDHASSDFDTRHSFSGALTYDIPSFSRSGSLAHVTKDWSIDTVVVARTGFPFNAVNLFTSPDPSGSALSRPDRVPGQPLWTSTPSAPGGKVLNANAFSTPLTVRQGSEGRNDIPGLGLTEVDLSIARRFPITDRLKLQFRTDAFNVFNHPNFTNPLAYFQFGSFYLQSYQMLNQGLGGLNSLFQQGGPRSIQLSLKLAF